MMEHRECLFLEARRSGDWSRYKEFTRTFLVHIKRYNSNIEKRIVKFQNSNSFYRYLNAKIQDRRCVGCLKCGNLAAFTELDKANMLAEHFGKTFIKDNDIVTSLPNSAVQPVHSMGDVPWFLAEELYEQILKWPNSSSVTPDLIPLSFIKKVACFISGPLAYIFNQSLMSGEVPRRWKHFITPILKKEPSSDPGNYRPVSITSLFCRLFEKRLKEHVIKYTLGCNLIPNQHGFTPGRSVETNMIECLDEWTKTLDNNGCCDVIYFDFAKAFDRVSHAKLIHKLKELKFHPVLITWITNFLTGRSFQVRVGKCYSVSKEVYSGVPQGGVLSPVLFNIFTAEIPSLFQGLGVSTKICR
ncbi:hypothetical protein COOONC_25572 [Cooperia oncophora]